MRKKKLAAAPAAAPGNVDPEFLTLNEAAERLRCSSKTIRRRIKDGLIRATREGGRRLIAIEDFYVYTERLRRSAKRALSPSRTGLVCAISEDKRGQCEPGVAKSTPV